MRTDRYFDYNGSVKWARKNFPALMLEVCQDDSLYLQLAGCHFIVLEELSVNHLIRDTYKAETCKDSPALDAYSLAGIMIVQCKDRRHD